MNLSKFLLFCLTFFLCINFIYSTCISKVEHIEYDVYSGSNYLGNFSGTNNNLIFVKSNLNEDNLRIIFKFKENDAYCIGSENNLYFYLFPGSLKETPVSLSKDSAEFVFDYNLKLKGNFQAKYSILSDGKSIDGQISFAVDVQGPSIDFIPIIPDEINKPLKAGSEVKFEAIITDGQSGIKQISITGQSLKIFNASKSETINISSSLDSSKSYIVTAEDTLGNKVTKSINFTIDSEPPSIQKINNKVFDKIYKSDGSNNEVKFFNIVFYDDYFDETNLYLYGDFKSINTNEDNIKLSCEVNETDSNFYICSTDYITITEFETTQNVDIFFNVKDKLGNNNTITVSNEEIFVDNDSPEKEKFELVNSLGIKNKINFRDNKSYVHLIFSDESLNKVNDSFYVDASFYWINNPQNLLRYNGCIKLGDIRYECVWDLNNSVLAYRDFLHQDVPYRVTLGDSYGNFNQFDFNVSIDNVKPQILDYEIILNEDIETGVIKSGDELDFKIFIKDENLENSGDYFVEGIFNEISTKTPLANAHCYPFNSSYECDFTGIEVKNGYFKENVTITITDGANNIESINIEVEVFKRGDEVPPAFHVEDLNEYNQINRSRDISSNYSNLLVLNPIAREDIVNSGEKVFAWFEGKLVLDDSNLDYQLVNYDLNCPANQLFLSSNGEEKVSVSEISLYPEGPIYYEEEGDEIFAIKVELEQYSNVIDLNNMSLECEISVLKKNNTTIYGLNHDDAEQVDFNMTFTFRGILRDDLLNSKTKEILNMINEIDSLEGTYNDIYDIYETLNSVCTVVGTVGGLLTSLSNVIAGVQYGLSAFSKLDGNTVAGKLGEGSYLPTAALGQSYFGSDSEGIGGGLGKMCDWVSCKVSKDLLDSAYSIGAGSNSNNFAMEFLNDVNEDVCDWTVDNVFQASDEVSEK